MRDLDSQETYLTDQNGFWLELRDLVGSGPNPNRKYTGPFGVVGTGEGWWAAELVREILGKDFVFEGTQFLLEASLGHPTYYSGIGDSTAVKLGFREDADVFFYPSPISSYRYLRFLLLATSNQDELTRVDRALIAEREHLSPSVPLSKNPAKLIAFSCYERIPLWVVPNSYSGLASMMQQTFARIGKSLSVAPPPSSLEFLITMLESQHHLGGQMSAVVFGEDSNRDLALNILEGRVETVIELPETRGEGTLARAMAYWYRVAWASYYLSMMYSLDPGDMSTMDELRSA